MIITTTVNFVLFNENKKFYIVVHLLFVLIQYLLNLKFLLCHLKEKNYKRIISTAVVITFTTQY